MTQTSYTPFTVCRVRPAPPCWSYALRALECSQGWWFWPHLCSRLSKHFLLTFKFTVISYTAVMNTFHYRTFFVNSVFSWFLCCCLLQWHLPKTIHSSYLNFIPSVILLTVLHPHCVRVWLWQRECWQEVGDASPILASLRWLPDNSQNPEGEFQILSLSHICLWSSALFTSSLTPRWAWFCCRFFLVKWSFSFLQLPSVCSQGVEWFGGFPL